MFCDGVEDCLLGEDEDGELCYKTDTVITDQREEQEEEEEEEENTRVRMEKVDPGDYSIDEAYFDMTIMLYYVTDISFEVSYIKSISSPSCRN